MANGVFISQSAIAPRAHSDVVNPEHNSILQLLYSAIMHVTVQSSICSLDHQWPCFCKSWLSLVCMCCSPFHRLLQCKSYMPGPQACPKLERCPCCRLEGGRHCAGRCCGGRHAQDHPPGLTHYPEAAQACLPGQGQSGAGLHLHLMLC